MERPADEDSLTPFQIVDVRKAALHGLFRSSTHTTPATSMGLAGKHRYAVTIFAIPSTRAAVRAAIATMFKPSWTLGPSMIRA